jgi:hypothetical protein
VRIRKVWHLREVVHADGDSEADTAVVRVAVAVAFENPFAGRLTHDLSALIELGPVMAEKYLPAGVSMLLRPPVAYGKAAIVGSTGEIEHGAALLHPKLGRAMRAAVGGGQAIIPSTCKVAGTGARIDVPLAHKDNGWSFHTLDTLTIGFEDAPRPAELLLVMVVSDGTRPKPRIPDGRVIQGMNE